MVRLILLCLTLLPLQAWAAPVVAAVAAAWAAYGTYVMVAMTVYSLYSSVSARRKARAAAAKARSDYLASLTDRRITVLSEESPRQVIYGEPAPLGGRIVAVLSSGDIDQFRHIVVMFAAHECDGFVDVLIDNDSAFPLDASGWSTSTKFNDTDDDGTANADDDNDNLAGTAPRLNIQLHTSAGGVDTADAFLMAACPEKWTAAHKASGYTYAVITFDLRLSRFQGGIPNITARLRGKKLHDPRTGLTAYSRNAALCTADFIQSRAGYGAKLSQFDLNDLIAAANASERGYNCDGAFSTDQDRDTTRQQLEDVMAGATLESGGVWRVLAGAWSSPLIALDDDDQLARPEVLQTCYPGTDRHNGAKGSYIKASGDGSAIDFPPYQNAVFREADGKDKFMDLTLPFVGHATQCRQLAMIRTEQSRGGLMLKITPKMLAWHLQPGDRLTLTSKFLGFTNKPFRVQDWLYSVASPLALQVIEDEESFYDEAEEQNEDPAPNADLPNPFIAASPPSSLTAASGPDWMVQQGDTLVARVRLSWDASGRQDVLSTGRTQVQWRMTASGVEWQAIEAPGNATSSILLGLQTGATYDIRARFVTALSTGTWANVSHTVLGLVDDPAAVAGLALTVADSGIRATWQAPRELDLLSWAYTELRLGATWAEGSVAYSGKATTALLPWMPAGNNLVWAAHANTVGGWSQSIVAALNVLAPGQPVISAGVQGKAIHLSWPDVRTTQPLEQHRIYVGASLATAVLLGYAGGTSFDYQESTPGTRTYWVVPYDKGGNAGPAGYIAVQSQPSIDEAVAELEKGLDDTLDLIRGETSDRINGDTRETLARVQGDADEKAARVRELAEAAAANAQKFAEERNARAQEISAAASQLQQQIQTLQAQIGDVLGAEEYAANHAYAMGDLVVFGEKLYRALQANVGVVPTDVAYWQLIGDYASIADAVVAQAAQISEASSRITQVGADVTALSAAQTSLAGRLMLAEGNLSAQSGALASLQQTVSNQGGALSANSNAITALTNKIASRPNLLANGSFERGIKGWSNLVVSGASANWLTGNDPTWGFRALRYGFNADSSTTGTLQSDPFPVRASVTYTITGDSLLLNAIAGDVGFDLYFLDSQGNVVPGGDGPNNVTTARHDFSVSDQYRNLHAVAHQAPVGATAARARFLFQGIRGGADCVVGCRQIKVEAGGLPATPYSVEAALAAESAAATLLASRVTANEAGLASASQSLVSLNDRVGSTESQDTAHSGAISGLRSDVSSINGALSSQNSLISNLQGSVSSLQNGKANADALSSLENRVHAAEGVVQSTSTSVDNLTNRVTGAEGVNSAQGEALGGLRSDVSSINGALSSHTSQLSNLQGSVSSLQSGKADAGALQSLGTRVGAAEANLSSTSTALTALTNKIVSRPNHLPNGSFERGFDGWSKPAVAGEDANWRSGKDSVWGFRVLRYGFNTASATTGALQSDTFPVRAGMTYTIAGDSVLMEATSGSVGFDLNFLDGNGAVVPGGDGPNNMVGVSHDFGVNDHYRNLHAVAYQAPAGSVQARARFIFESIRGGANCVIGCRQIKVEAGGLPATPYSMEASLAVEAAATRTLESKVTANESGLASASASMESLANRVGAAESRDSAQSTAISGLQSDVSSINGALSSYTNQLTYLQAQLANRPNLLPNGGFEAGSKNWRADGWSVGDTSTWGSAAIRSNTTGTFTLESERFPLAGPATYTITGDSLLLNATAGSVYFDLQFYAANGQVLKDGLQKPVSTSHDFSTGNGIRDAHAVSEEAPAGTAFAVARFVASGIQGANAIVGCRMVKVERGGLPATGYSAEATAATEAAAVSSLTAKVTQAGENITAQASQFTGLSSTVAGHTASISQQASTLASLNGQIQSTWVLNVTAGGKVAGMAFRNDGTTRDLVFLTDRFAVATNDTGSGVYPFVLGNVGGVPTAAFNANMVVDGGIQTRHLGAQQVTADKMKVNQLSVLTQDVGDLTAGVIRNPSSTNFFNLNATGGQWALCAGGGKFYATADGYVEADRVNIRRRDVIATGTVYWGGEWRADGEGNRLLVESLQYISGAFIVDTGIDLNDASDFGVVQPYYAIAACNNAATSGGGTGSDEQFSLTVSCEVALASAHRVNSGATPSPNPRLRIIVRPHITISHPSLWRVQLNTFNWSLFRI